MTSSTGISRNPTMPLTKRDSQALNGSRISLISNSSANQNSSSGHTSNKTGMRIRRTSGEERKEFKDSDFVNSHPNMVAGKKRTTKKVKRTDSYKQALNGQCAFNDLETDLPSDKNITKHKKHDTESRAKYNTLPIKMDTVVTDSKPDVKRKIRPDHNEHDQFQRTASQKSGTFPSPDTDEDQHSIQPERKKKSTFKRMKERLIQTFRIDRYIDTQYKSRNTRPSKSRHRTVSGGRVRPNNQDGSRGFQTPNSLENDGKEVRGEPMEIEIPSPSRRRKFLATIRSSFRRKSRPEKYLEKKQSAESDKLDRYYANHRITEAKVNHSNGRMEYSNNKAKPQTDKDLAITRSDPIDIPSSQTTDDQTGPTYAAIEEYPTEADDTISEIFGSLIDPSCTVFTPPSRPRPDRSKLKLEGLKKFRPKSFEKKDTAGAESPRNARAEIRGQGRASRPGDLSPTVEIDGLDYADAPVRPVGQFQEESDENLPYEIATPSEQQRRTDDVGRRLAAIGDRIVADKESESATSSSEAGSRRLSAFEQEILDDLRKFADAKNKEMNEKGGVSIFVVPIVKKLLLANSYNDFKQTIHRELSSTMGWEQVAWYTYLIRTTMCVVGTGKDVGRMVKNNATRYFNSNIRPFIQSRPNGWESIHEETDIEDSELD